MNSEAPQHQEPKVNSEIAAESDLDPADLTNNNLADGETLDLETDKELELETPEITEQPQAPEVTISLKQNIAELEQQKASLEAEIRELQEHKNKLLSQQMLQWQETMDIMVKKAVQDLEQRHSTLQRDIEEMERRRERIREEMRTTFAGASQELAIRVQGFKDYLVGSLQDLSVAAEQLELPSFEPWEQSQVYPQPEAVTVNAQPQFAEQAFHEQVKRIRAILNQYRTLPDYYGPPWQLRRTFEPIHAERVENWFFSQGGKGAIRTMGSRLQNILVASAVISVLHNLYGDRLRTLVLANIPERLGEWRRGLQDCLGISRTDFGPERGVVLFEQPEALVQKAERVLEEELLPLVIIDETENTINLSLLQYPLWLAFAPEANQYSSYMY